MIVKFRPALAAAFGVAALVTLAPAAMAQEWSDVDSDQDGFVTMDEFNEVMPDAGEEMFSEVDADDDDLISESEWTDATEAGMFASDGGGMMDDTTAN